MGSPTDQVTLGFLKDPNCQIISAGSGQLENAIHYFAIFVDTFPRLSLARRWSQSSIYVNIRYEQNESAL